MHIFSELKKLINRRMHQVIFAVGFIAFVGLFVSVFILLMGTNQPTLCGSSATGPEEHGYILNVATGLYLKPVYDIYEVNESAPTGDWAATLSHERAMGRTPYLYTRDMDGVMRASGTYERTPWEFSMDSKGLLSYRISGDKDFKGPIGVDMKKPSRLAMTHSYPVVPLGWTDYPMQGHNTFQWIATASAK